MSTKTLRKRIALVAVSAMGAGLLSLASAPIANAATTAPSSMTLSTGSLIAGTRSVTLTMAGGTGAIDSIKVINPLGAVTYWTNDTAGDVSVTKALNDGTTNPSYASRVFTFAANYFLEPGTYTIFGSVAAAGAADTDTKINAGITAGTYKSVSLRVDSPATSTEMGISMDASNYAIDSQPIVRAWRPTSGVTGEIKFIATRSADAGLVVGLTKDGNDTSSTTGNYDYYQLGITEDDVAGTYSMTAFVDSNDNGIIDASEPSASITFYITSASGSTDVITTTVSKSLANDEDEVTICSTVTDAYGRPLVNALQVKADVDWFDDGNASTTSNLSTSYQNMTRQGTSNTYCFTTTVESSAITTDYVDATVTVANSGATATDGSTAVIRVFDITDATIPTTEGAQIFVLESADGIGSVTSGVRQTLYSTGAVDIGSSGTPIAVDRATVTQNYTLNLGSIDAGEYVKFTVAPTAGTPSTVLAPSVTYKQIGADGVVKFQVTSVAPAATNGYQLTVAANIATTDAYVAFGTPTPQITVSPTATIKAKYGAETPLTATLSDQFGRPMSGKTLVYTTSGGRNATITGTLTTGADGSAAYTVKDLAGAADTVNLTDTVTFTYNYLNSLGEGTTATGTRNVTYSATGVVIGSITLTPAATTPKTISPYSNTGASEYLAYTAQVYLSTGLPAGSGVLVTCSAGPDDLFFLGVKTAVTGTDGTAVCNLYRLKIGAIAVKASAGGISSNTATAVKWVINDGDTKADGSAGAGPDTTTDARNITITSTKVTAGSAATVVAKVTDRWGNPVSGVGVTWSYSGVGRPIAGADLTVGTDTNGQVQLQMTSLSDELGVANVTATIDTGTNQTLDLADYVGLIKSTGAPAGNYVATGTVTFSAPVVTGVTNAEVLAAIVKLIASINKQIVALQKLLTKKK